MAWLESRNNSWRVAFRYHGRKHTFTVGEVSERDAAVHRASTEELLRLLKRNLVSIPAGCSIEDFMFHRGKPAEHTLVAANGKSNLTLLELRDAYLRSQERKLEPTTLDGIRLHFNHLERLLGPSRMIPTLMRPDLQKYVDKRSDEWIDPNVYRKARRARLAAKPRRNFRNPRPPKIEPPDKPKRHPSSATVKKEIVSLRTAWNWARRHLGLAEEFPGTGLDFAKIEEGLPFMTWDEAEARIAAGDTPENVWDCVFLRPDEIMELLHWVKSRPISPWVYPMFAFAAYTGARRSEIVRLTPADMNLSSSVVTIREKKRDRTKLTTRRVPLTPLLKQVLADWMTKRGKGKTLFCKTDGKPIAARETHNYFQRALRISKWSVLKGWHVFRHSFISALASKGVDQRIIDDFVGHQTDEQRRRYRHLFPSTKENAIRSVFG